MRRRRPEKRTINPDPKFNDLQISKFMNYLLTDGKKGIAEKILYDAFDIVQDKSKKDPIDIFKKALNNCLLYTSPSPRDDATSRMPSSA